MKLLPKTVRAVLVAALATTALVTPQASAPALAEPTITETTIPFVGTSISAVSGEEAWVVGRDRYSNSNIRTARIRDGVATEYELPWAVQGTTPQIVSTGSATTWLLRDVRAFDSPSRWPAKLYRWDNRHWYPSDVPTTMTLPNGVPLYLESIAGSPVEGLRGLFNGKTGASYFSEGTFYSRVGTWNGTSWVMSSKAVCTDEYRDWPPNFRPLSSTSDGWLVLCQGTTYEVTHLDGSALDMVPVSHYADVAALSASDVYTWGALADYTGPPFRCLHVVNATVTACPSPFTDFADSAVANRWGQIYVASENVIYRFYPSSGRYERILEAEGSSESTWDDAWPTLSASPYSPQVWAVSGHTVYRGS